MANILIIEDETILARNMSDSLRFGGHETEVAHSGEDGLAALELFTPEIVLVDYRLPGIDGIEVLARMQSLGMTAATIMITAHGNIETAVEAMKKGASDFLTKPLDLQYLQLVVERTLTHRKTCATLDYLRDRERVDAACDRIIGESPCMQDVKSLVQRITSTQVLASDRPPSVLILGETGTGKDLIARAIHYSGPRKRAQFVHVNCTAIPDHLVESELFGHVKGAFTDARSNKVGLFEVADRGTVFLDEVGHMPLALQAKLLAVLEQRTVRPVGGTKDRAVDVHVIAATNRNLKEAIGAREFRDDLYHRLRVLTISMPPLRERGEDALQLAEHFLHHYAHQFGVKARGFAADAVEIIERYDWPGNVRELMHAIESAVLTTDNSMIRGEHLNIQVPDLRGAIDIILPTTRKTITMEFEEGGTKLEEIEYEIIQGALDHAKHNLSRAARILGISRDAIRYRLDKYRDRSKTDD